MEHNIVSLISEEDISKLKSIIKDGATKLHVTDDSEFFSSIKLEGASNTIYLINEPTILSDGDEYPTLRVVDNLQVDYSWSFRSILSSITMIHAIRDVVSWEYNGRLWNVTCDVGLFLKDPRSLLQFWIQSVDSIGGLIKFGEGLFDMTDPSSIQDYWSFKTDLPSQLKRDIIQV